MVAGENDQSRSLELATDLAIAWLSNPATDASAEEIALFLQKVHGALDGLGSGTGAEKVSGEPEYTPAVSVRQSLASKDHIISMIDGKPYRALRRHLSTHGLTAEQYRERYGLSSDYPMVSESYSQVRRAMALKIGLGRKPGEKPGQRKRTSTASRSGGKSEAG